jgi:hypothetical protein
MSYKDLATRREYNRNWLLARRLEWESKQECALCGRRYPDVRIEAHHRDQSQKVSHRIWSWSEERRAAELKKCTPLCNECHIAYERGKKMQTQHGTAGMYHRGCSCEACRAWNANRVRNNRANIAQS